MGAGLAGLAVIALSPDIVATHLSTDGKLTPAATEWLWTYRGFAAAAAISLLGAGVAVVGCRRGLEPVLARHAGLGCKLLLMRWPMIQGCVNKWKTPCGIS